MSILQILVYAIVQGITEQFPVSSVGHAVILPYLLGWTNVSDDPQFLPFVVMLHLGTALALLIYFRNDWIKLIGSLFGRGDSKDRRMLGLIVVATIPAAIIGKLFEHGFRHLFPFVLSAGIFLLVNGLVLAYADRLMKRRQKTVGAERITYGQSLLIGAVQVFALIPGFSRSGITMTAGLAAGLSYESAARFSFLLATPVILGAGVLEVPKVMHAHATAMLHAGLLAGLLTAIIAFLATGFLMKYFSRHEALALRPFARYCILFGAAVVILAAFHLHL